VRPARNLPAFLEGIGNAAELRERAICGLGGECGVDTEKNFFFFPFFLRLGGQKESLVSWPDSTAAWLGDQQFKAGAFDPESDCRSGSHHLALSSAGEAPSSRQLLNRASQALQSIPGADESASRSARGKLRKIPTRLV